MSQAGNDGREVEASSDVSTNSGEQEKGAGIVSTRLTAWSWGIQQRPPTMNCKYGLSQIRDPVGIATDAPAESPCEDGRHPLRSAYHGKMPRKSVRSVHLTDPAGPSHIDAVHGRQRRLTDPESRNGVLGGRPLKTPPPGIVTLPPGMSETTRQLLLSNRKLSELADEEDYFRSHRDSVVLGRQRLLGNQPHQEAPPASNSGSKQTIEAVAETLRQSTWTQSRLYCDEGDKAEAQKSALSRRLFEESRPINALATKIRSPWRGTSNESQWLTLSEDAPPPLNESRSNDEAGFLALVPTVHPPAVIEDHQKELPSSDTTSASSVVDVKRQEPRGLRRTQSSWAG